jgi:hypothetical protein
LKHHRYESRLPIINFQTNFELKIYWRQKKCNFHCPHVQSHDANTVVAICTFSIDTFTVVLDQIIANPNRPELMILQHLQNRKLPFAHEHQCPVF